MTSSLPRRQRKADDLPACPYEAIVTAYHDALPDLPSVRLMSDGRKAAMRTLWRWVFTSRRSDNTVRASTPEEAIEWVKAYFARASTNDFLMGRGERFGKHAGWRADFDFLLTQRGLKHVIEKTVDPA